MNDDEASGRQLENQIHVENFVRTRLKRATQKYDLALTSLWVGNGAGSLAVLSFIGATWENSHFPSKLLCPLGIFVFGLMTMGLGTLVTLILEARIIREMENANSILELKVGLAKRQSENAGLTFNSFGNIMAAISGLCFVLGCIVGLFLLYYSNQ
jgi:hypothetical protein